MYGPEPKQVLSLYAWLTGPTPLPPLWSLGFQQSRYSYSPESELLPSNTGCAQTRFPVMPYGWISIFRRTTCRLRSIHSVFRTSPKW